MVVLNILRDKADFEVFEGLMTVLFGKPVKIIELLESESNRETKEAMEITGLKAEEIK